MFSREQFDHLAKSGARPAVSLMLATHRAGREVRQDPVRLRNLIDQAAEKLEAAGTRPAEAERLLAPARALVKDGTFWREQEEGLAVFAAPGLFETLRVPAPLPEEVVVGSRFHLRHLLPLLEDHPFWLLALSAQRARLYRAGRDAMEETKIALPQGVQELAAGTEYQVTRHAAPVARPHSGTLGGVRSQSLGDDTGAARKSELTEYLRRVGALLEPPLAAERHPLVLAAHPEMQGHFRALARLPDLLPKGIAENPDHLDDAELCRRGAGIIAPLFAAKRREALDQFRQAFAAGTPRAANKPDSIVTAAREGRVDTLFIGGDRHLWGRVDPQTGRIDPHGAPAPGDDDMVDYAACLTLAKNGHVQLLAADELPGGGVMAALLRY